VSAWVEVLDFRLDGVKGTGSGDAVDDDLVPDLILPKANCCWYMGSDGFLNGKRYDLRTEVAGVLSLVIRRMLWLVVNSMVAISGFLIAELIVFLMVRLLVLSGSAVPSLSMTIVRSRLVKTEGRGFLFGEGVGVEAGAALAAFWAHVTVGSGAMGLGGGAGVW
jgi:hypothetical protein